MRALIAGLVIALGIAEIAMSATALYAERTDMTPPTMGAEVRTDPDQRPGTEPSGVAILGLGVRPTIEKSFVETRIAAAPRGSPPQAVGRRPGGRA